VSVWRIRHTDTFCPHSVFMYFVWFLEQTAIISLCSINWLVCITETERVYCAIRAETLSIINPTSGVKVSKLAGYNGTVYVQHSIMERSRNYWCHGNATIRSLFTMVSADVADNIKVFTVVMEMQQWVPFALLSRYKIFCTAVNNNNY
jgi:hypothetical protein